MEMKKNKETFILFILSCIFQAYFFYLQNRMESPFSYMFGIQQESGKTEFLYMEILAVYIPLYFAILYFKDCYSFYIGNYGKLWLVRNKNRKSYIAKIYLQMMKKIIFVEFGQAGIWMVWRYDYFLENKKIILAGIILYFWTLLWIFTAEVLLNIYMKENRMLVILNSYLLIALFVNWMFNGKWIIYLFFPGIIIKGSNLIQKIMDQDIQAQIGLLYSGIMILIFYKQSKIKFQKKDLFW